MPLEKTEAVILKSFNWSESSRTIHFFTREYGRISLIDKGGRRIASRRGRLLPFTRLEVTFYQSKKESAGYISDTTALETFSLDGDGELGRLAYASAACELLFMLLPEQEANPSLFGYFLSFLGKNSSTEKRFLPAVFVTFFMRLLSGLGFHPSVSFCSGCGKKSEEIEKSGSRILFSPERGGLICAACQKPGEYYIQLSGESTRLLGTLQRASLGEAETLPIGYEEATVLIEVLTKFLKYHSGMKSDLKSLEFLEKLKKSQFNI